MRFDVARIFYLLVFTGTHKMGRWESCSVKVTKRPLKPKGLLFVWSALNIVFKLRNIFFYPFFPCLPLFFFCPGLSQRCRISTAIGSGHVCAPGPVAAGPAVSGGRRSVAIPLAKTVPARSRQGTQSSGSSSLSVGHHRFRLAVGTICAVILS